MTSLKEILLNRINQEVQKAQKEMQELKNDLRIFDAELIVENRLSEEKIDVKIFTLREGHREEIEANIAAINSIKSFTQNRITELRKELDLLEARKIILTKLEENALEKHLAVISGKE